MKTLNIKLVRENAVLPKRATQGSAGYDLSATIEAPVTVRHGEIAKIPTGVAIALEPGTVALVFGRSGLGFKHGVMPANAVGVIDSDYRGEITVALTCQLQEEYVIEPGERIAQMVIMPVLTPELVLCDQLEDTVRGQGGFGSTGRS
ncbi:MAG: dUTP diphosphatase [Angelakisella sp.]|nr:dUTP diphosphatase [Angelakisella sp.]